MLDWMKKLFKKEEEEQHAPDVLELARYSYKQERDVQQEEMPQRAGGKFRFPIDARDVQAELRPRETTPEPVQPVESLLYIQREKTPEPPVYSTVRPQRRELDLPEVPVLRESPRRPEVPPRRLEPPVLPGKPEAAVPPHRPEPPVLPRKAEQAPAAETRKRPFRLTETISPVFGYKRPSYDLHRKQPPTDLVLSANSRSVVDAWLEKHGLLPPEEEIDLAERTTAAAEEEPYAYAEHEAAAEAEEEEEPYAYAEHEAAMEAEEVFHVYAERGAEPEAEEELHVYAERGVEPEEFAEAEEEPHAYAEREAEPEAAAEAEEEELQVYAEQEAEPEELAEAEEELQVYAEQEAEPEELAEAEEELQVYAEQEAEPEELAEAEEELQVYAEQEAEPEELAKAEEELAPAEPETEEQPSAIGLPREKKRFVPYNVIMLKQDRLRLQAQPKPRPLEEPVPSEDPREAQEPAAVEPAVYTMPSVDLLQSPPASTDNDEEWLDGQRDLLDTTFRNFNIGAKVVHLTQGPSVTRFEVQPEPGVKVNKITNLADDIKLNLAARDIRIEAPIPGKNAVGIEVPNRKSKPVFLRDILQSPAFAESGSPLTVALGLDISGTPIVTDIRKMPHGLIAGSTGSGKSVCINAILTSILYKAKPHEVKLMLIDPKMVELAPYNAVPHLVSPVITDAKAATAALKWAVEEMERRYETFAHVGARDLGRYNDMVKLGNVPGEQLPYLVIVIDELADLMMVSPADVEEAICRIAQKARACGIHLLVATQRPSVDVITGLIKANIPTRIAFTVSSQVDSRTIIDIAGAEKLLGRGDMLFLENGTAKPLRVQGVYVSDDEIEHTVAHVKEQMKPDYLFRQDELLKQADRLETEDELFYEACQFVLAQGGASTSLLQRQFRIGYNRAARLIEEMENQGIISQARGTKPRDVLMTEEELQALQDMNA